MFNVNLTYMFNYNVCFNINYGSNVYSYVKLCLKSLSIPNRFILFVKFVIEDTSDGYSLFVVFIKRVKNCVILRDVFCSTCRLVRARDISIYFYFLPT